MALSTSRPTGSVGEIFRAIRSAGTMSRAEIAEQTGLAPSTVSLRVDVLVGLGLLRETGVNASRGGRRSRRLELDGSAGYVASVDVGAKHIAAGLTDAAGRTLRQEERMGSFDGGPEELVAWLWAFIEEMIAASGLDPDRLMGVGVGITAPVEHPSGRVVHPAFMPSLSDAVIPKLFHRYTAVPVLAENDANLLALAELATTPYESDQLLAVKLGTRIGCGVVSDGRLHRGIRGAAGEVGHSSAEGIAMISCSCGIETCLESVASGGALVAQLSELGYDVESSADVVAQGQTGDPVVVDILRTAGGQIGETLSRIVNFFNPRAVVLGGGMAASEHLVAAIRAQLFQRCLPVVANDLEVRPSRSPEDAPLRGASFLILDEVLSPARIDALARGDEEAQAADPSADRTESH
ncbi:ROK family protein [Microbacterium sp.]|uniref:ROK family protein n=1 Tax=Microbacterium sp. TaxID=51671 RepID=UPI003F94CEAB